MTAQLIDYQHGREIPDEVFLAAVWKAGGHGEFDGWAMRWDVDRILGGFGPDDDLSEGVPGVPWKVSLQKAKRLMKRGLLGGCDCGCRGDYYLTDAGKALLEVDSDGSDRSTELGPFLAAIRADVAALADSYDIPNYVMTLEPGGTVRVSVAPRSDDADAGLGDGDAS